MKDILQGLTIFVAVLLACLLLVGYALPLRSRVEALERRLDLLEQSLQSEREYQIPERVMRLERR